MGNDSLKFALFMDYVIDQMKRDDWEQVSLILREGIATGYTTFETGAPSWEKWDVGHLETGRLVARKGDKVVGQQRCEKSCYAVC